MEIRFSHPSIGKFIHSLEVATFAKTIRTLELLESYGYRLSMPHSKQIDRGLFELRIRGIQEVRLLYMFKNQTIIILHGFLKKSMQLPIKEVALALRRKAELENI